MKVAVIQSRIDVGDFTGNVERLVRNYNTAVARGAEIVVGPEDALAGYCEGDQRFYPSFMVGHDAALSVLLKAVGEVPFVVGITEKNPDGGKPFYNTAIFIENGAIVHRQVKTNLATDTVFNDYRYYEPNPDPKPSPVFEYRGVKCAMLVCQDIWATYDAIHGEHFFRRNPVVELVGEGIELLLVPNASPYYWGKGRERYEMVEEAREKLGCAIAYANYAGGHDELVFDGRSFIVNAKGDVVGAGKPFAQDEVVVADLDGPSVPYPFGDDIADLEASLVTGLSDYVEKKKIAGVVFGLSGGIDSALCAVLAVKALGPERVIGIRMPSQYSSQGSLDDAEALAKNLRIRCDTVSIKEVYAVYEKLLADTIGFGTPSRAGDMTEENIQARARGALVMAYANKYGYMAIATGNKSEFSVGYATLYGDMCGGYALIKDVFKMDIYRLSEWANSEREVIPRSSIEKPPSAELRHDQKDTDSLPDYPVLDAILKGLIERFLGRDELIAEGFDPKVVEKVIAMTDYAEFKRRQAPPGPIVSKEGLAWLNRQYPMSTKYSP
jgi:NAD+ synthetase